MNSHKVFASLFAVVLLLAVSNTATAAITILFPMNDTEIQKDTALGVYGQTTPGAKVSVTVLNGGTSTTKIKITADANGFFNTSFAAPAGGWTKGAASITALEVGTANKDTNDITFIE